VKKFSSESLKSFWWVMPSHIFCAHHVATSERDSTQIYTATTKSIITCPCQRVCVRTFFPLDSQ
jgi:hypothetical protein